MAAAKRLQNIKAEVTCPICLELFWDPVTAECGHSFCRKCITRYREGDEDVACPQCKEKLRKRHLLPNRELRNIVEFLSLQTAEDLRGGHVCERHRQPLQLYCKKDQTPICVVCERAQDHRGHSVVPVEEAVQEYWETLTKHLAGIESTYGRLHPLVSLDRKHFSHSAGEEALRKVKRLAENMATLLKVHTEGPRQRFADAASQPQPRDPVWRGVSPRREAAGELESQGPAGREPGSEREHGRRQASLDPNSHTISNTTQFEDYKVDVKSLVSRFEKPTSPGPSEVRVGRRKDRVSPAGQGAAQTESGGDTGGGGRGSQEPKVAAAGVHRGARPSSVTLRRYNSLRESQTHQQADALSRGDSLQSWRLMRSRQHSGGSGQVGVSPGGRVAQPPELQGCAVEVTLDPATAHARLVLSEDRKSARRGDPRQDLPDTPERFDYSVCVVGSEGFTSGRRYWEVEVESGGHWAIGVARDSVQRKGRIQPKPDEGIWALDSFYVSQVPRKVGVYLDYEGGEVRFYDAETMALISSLTDTFTGRLVPFFHLRTVGSRISLSPCQR